VLANFSSVVPFRYCGIHREPLHGALFASKILPAGTEEGTFKEIKYMICYSISLEYYFTKQQKTNRILARFSGI